MHLFRERACPFRLLRFRRHPPVVLTQYVYRQLFTINYSLLIIHHSLFIGAVTDRPLFAFPLRSLRGRCRLRQMRCKYIRAAGATFFSEAHFFSGASTLIPIRILRYPGVEVTDETGKLPPYSSAALKSAPHPLGRALLARFFILCLPYGKLLNNTSSVTKGDTFPSSSARGRQKEGRSVTAPMNNE